MAVEIAGPVGGVVHVRHQDHGAREPIPHGVHDRLEVAQEARHARVSGTVGRPDEREQVVAARGQGHDGIPARVDRLQRAELRREHVFRRRPVGGQEAALDPGEPGDEIPARELRPHVVVVAGQQGGRAEAGDGQPQPLAAGVIEIGVPVDRHAVAEGDVRGQHHEGIISGERGGKIGACLASTV